MSVAGRYPLHQRTRFVFSYALAKLAVLWEVRKPKLSFFMYEMLYSMVNALRLLRPTLKPRLYSGPDLIDTIYGKFRVRAGTHDAAIVSPAFERRDREYLDRILGRALSRSNDVYFLDIGANIGAFSVSVAREFPRLKVCAFEPAPANLTLLEENLRLNGLKNVTIFPFALSDRRGSAKLDFQSALPGDSRLGNGSVTIETRRLEEILPDISMTATVVIKIDVEGHEPQVLNGIGDCLRGRPVYLMIEDMFDSSNLYVRLQAMGFHFVAKLSPYNSWWEKS